MKIALLGYGRMGKAIEKIAKERGHEVVLIVDENNRTAITGEDLQKADVAIDFSIPAVAVDNCKWCFENGVPVVCGTTGWLDRWEELTAYCKDKAGGFFYASNYSIGVNLFFHLNQHLAKLMSGFTDYKVYVEETHHIHKLDVPSGTAITIAEDIIKNHPAYASWELVHETGMVENVIPVTAKREGEVPGIHSVAYKSNVDEIQIYHSAYTREGFAHGAVIAAEFMVDKKGIFGMDDLLKI
ncbi:MAG: 4-hydroxy-tetrahydrodipicolinate reductase [Odoribacter sp.]|nr:4-hydroxy-tetrahydrodipicolinate reductase [Odoribacter sp.]